ncbi:hypothetical protein THMIRHAS_23970 [Thiosulfatimonas sediminis]|uniref:Uncharacterized protein n=1 Tax=Thiosulfatimonas sediminis TaxID=2675054 RepID=A0A6F8PYF3_9GAMM|nr:hypothetical protein [Thiosulfatimonas sediminis]BBP47024.1 hypothetical protein THMIRHAS_23970 [Thiosulfatimonas sediminis]
MDTLKIGEVILEFSSLTGQVISSNKRTKTDTYSEKNIFDDDITVRTDHHDEHEFWVRSSSGKDHHYTLKHHRIPLLEGQKVTLIFISEKNYKNRILSTIVNHNSNQHWHLISLSRLNKSFPVTKEGKGVIPVLIIFLTLGLLFESTTFFYLYIPVILFWSSFFGHLVFTIFILNRRQITVRSMKPF